MKGDEQRRNGRECSLFETWYDYTQHAFNTAIGAFVIACNTGKRCTRIDACLIIATILNSKWACDNNKRKSEQENDRFL